MFPWRKGKNATVDPNLSMHVSVIGFTRLDQIRARRDYSILIGLGGLYFVGGLARRLECAHAPHDQDQ